MRAPGLAQAVVVAAAVEVDVAPAVLAVVVDELELLVVVPDAVSDDEVESADAVESVADELASTWWWW